jgi:TonB-dependent receptor
MIARHEKAARTVEFAVAGVLRSGVVLAVGASFFTTAYAADTVADVEEVIVTGIRQSIESAQEIKRNAEQIVDSVAAVDITALPDRTVTETLQRIPGIAIDHLFAPSDTNRFSAEGSGVVIRGMTQVRSELNGRDVFSARNTRGLSFEDVPSELMAGVDVYKNPSAEMIEGGIGGTVNLRTRKPFDSSGTVFGATASVNYGDFAEDFKPQASTLFSTRWDTGIGEMGLLLNAAYSELATRTDSIQFGRPFRRDATSLIGSVNDAVEDCPSMAGGTFSCVYLPAGARWSELDFDRERIGGAIAFQWRPSDRTELSVQALHSEYTRTGPNIRRGSKPVRTTPRSRPARRRCSTRTAGSSRAGSSRRTPISPGSAIRCLRIRYVSCSPGPRISQPARRLAWRRCASARRTSA